VAFNYEEQLARYTHCPVHEVDGQLPISDVTAAICERVLKQLGL